jgi:cytochrome oxidase Cu insertion factor (SCO1/SenC/PrrC family)
MLRQVGLPAGLLAACAVIVLLALEKRSLEAENDGLRRLSEWPYPGFPVPFFTSTTLEGEIVEVGAPSPGTHQILVFFTTTCPYCLESVPAWRSIGEAAGAEPTVELIGISLDPERETRAYLAEHGLDLPVVLLDPRSRWLKLFRMRGVPYVAVVDSEGTLTHARFAAVPAESAAQDSILDFARGAPPRD